MLETYCCCWHLPFWSSYLVSFKYGFRLRGQLNDTINKKNHIFETNTFSYQSHQKVTALVLVHNKCINLLTITTFDDFLALYSWLSAVSALPSLAWAEIIGLCCQVGAINELNVILCIQCLSRSCLIKDLATGATWDKHIDQIIHK